MKWLCYKCLTSNEEASTTCTKCHEPKPTESLTPPRFPTETQAAQIPLGAGFGIRFLARFIDILYGAFLGFAAGIGTSIAFAILSRLGYMSPDWPHLIRRTSFAGFGLSILGAFLYHTFSEGIGTVSVGKGLCGLRVVQIDGSPATMKGAFIRDLAYHLDALFFGLIAYSSMCTGPLEQRYGDVWGKTVVVKKTIFKPQPERSSLRMFSGILVGSLIWAAMIVLSLLLKVI